MNAKFKGLNPWADVMLSHLLMGKLSYDVAVNVCGVPLRMVDAQLQCYEPRLNPLEFHGRRDSRSISQRTDSARCTRRSFELISPYKAYQYESDSSTQAFSRCRRGGVPGTSHGSLALVRPATAQKVAAQQAKPMAASAGTAHRAQARQRRRLIGLMGQRPA